MITEEINKGYKQEHNPALDKLKEAIKKETQQTLYALIRKLDKNVTTLQNILNGRAKMRPEWLELIFEEMPNLDIEQFAKEILPATDEEPATPRTQQPQAALTPSPRDAVRFFPHLNATAGNVDGLPADEVEYEIFNIRGYGGCDAFPATGDSMLPTIKAGDIVMHKQWTESYIQNGEIYIIVTRNGQRAIKRLSVIRTEDREDGVCPSFFALQIMQRSTRLTK